jgi:hypothetical protein
MISFAAFLSCVIYMMVLIINHFKSKAVVGVSDAEVVRFVFNSFLEQKSYFHVKRQVALLKTFGITTLSTLLFEVTFTILDWTCTFANLSWGATTGGGKNTDLCKLV